MKDSKSVLIKHFFLRMREVPGYYGREESYRPSPSFIPQNLERPERNDCEIIVVSKPLTSVSLYTIFNY